MNQSHPWSAHSLTLKKLKLPGYEDFTETGINWNFLAKYPTTMLLKLKHSMGQAYRKNLMNSYDLAKADWLKRERLDRIDTELQHRDKLIRQLEIKNQYLKKPSRRKKYD